MISWVRRKSAPGMVVTLGLVLLLGLGQMPAMAQANERVKPRVVLMLDPELDDLNTLVRYLLYSNQFQTEGLVYQSSDVHWKGDDQGTPYDGPRGEHRRIGIHGPLTYWRWEEDESFIEDAVEIYAEVYPNLIVHAEGYPHPDELRSRIFVGNVEFPGDMSKESPGSELIKSLLLDDEPGPVYLLSGAGQSTIGRALLSIQEEYENTPEWPDIYKKVSNKAIIQAWGDQDGVYASYIGPNWPDIEFRDMRANVWGYGARGAVLPEDREYLSAAWMRQYVSDVGPFGEFYRVWGDGKQMSKGDLTDFFGFAGLTVEQLTELGYWVWLRSVGEPGSWISEGDTPIFLNLLDNGLDAHIDPAYGGWGGRDGEDIDPNGVPSRNYTSARWFGAAQRDFAARMRWTVTPNYEDANHNPVVELVSPMNLLVRPGETVMLRAIVRDPDGDNVTARWWQYVEAGTYPGRVTLSTVSEQRTSRPNYTYPADVPPPGSPAVAAVIRSEIDVASQFTVPEDAVEGQTLHFILEASDFGEPSLTTYLRVVLTVVE